jgi:hypothetical protein
LRTGGTVFAGDATVVPADQRVLVVSDGVGTTHRVRVRLANPYQATAGPAALRVRLSGPGEQPDRTDTLFLPGAADPRTLALVQPDEGEFTIRYEVEGYTVQGLPRPGQSQTMDDELVLALPG